MMKMQLEMSMYFFASIKQIIMSLIMGKEPEVHMRTANVQVGLRILAVSSEPMLFAHVSGRPRDT